MKQTEKWLPIAQKKAQSELTLLRQQIRALDSFYSINRLPELIALRRPLSDDVRSLRYYLKYERSKAIERGDLSPSKYRPSPPNKESIRFIPLDKIPTTPIEQRELLLVG